MSDIFCDLYKLYVLFNFGVVASVLCHFNHYRLSNAKSCLHILIKYIWFIIAYLVDNIFTTQGSFVCTQLNGSNYYDLIQGVLFDISILFVHRKACFSFIVLDHYIWSIVLYFSIYLHSKVPKNSSFFGFSHLIPIGVYTIFLNPIFHSIYMFSNEYNALFYHALKSATPSF